MRVLSDAREAAWGVVQGVVSELEFDFHELRPRALRAPAVGGRRTRLRGVACSRRLSPRRHRRAGARGGRGSQAAPAAPTRAGGDHRRRRRRGFDRLPPGGAGRARRGAARAQRADQRLDLPLGRARRPAALERVADPDHDGLRRALPEARLRVGGVRRRAAGVHPRARAGGPAPGRVGAHVRAAAGADLPGRGPRPVPADEHRGGPVRVLPAERRLPRPVAADGRAGGGRARGRLPDLHAHARRRDRRAGRTRAGRAHRVGRHRGRGGRQRGRHVRRRDRAPRRGAGAGRAVRPRVPGHAAVSRAHARGAPGDVARPRPADLLPRGGRRAGDGRLRARPPRRGRSTSTCSTRSRRTSTAACSKRTGRGSRRSPPTAAAASR